jgi:hypothetical protein
VQEELELEVLELVLEESRTTIRRHTNVLSTASTDLAIQRTSRRLSMHQSIGHYKNHCGWASNSNSRRHHYY